MEHGGRLWMLDNAVIVVAVICNTPVSSQKVTAGEGCSALARERLLSGVWQCSKPLCISKRGPTKAKLRTSADMAGQMFCALETP
jgi:ribosomal protein L37AE/L43A